MATRASASSGVPVTAVTHSAPAKRSAPRVPPRPAKRSAIISCPSPRTLTAKARQRCSTGQDEEFLFTKALMRGGSMEKDETEVAVKPARSVPLPIVRTDTAPAKARIAALNSAAISTESARLLISPSPSRGWSVTGRGSPATAQDRPCHRPVVGASPARAASTAAAIAKRR